MANIDADAVKQAVKRHPDFIVGLKARYEQQRCR